MARDSKFGPSDNPQIKIDFGYQHFVPYKCIGGARNNLRSHFDPMHWADLLKSGLEETIIWQSGVYSVSPDQISSILGFYPNGVRSALAFPYPGFNFIRLKVFPELVDMKGHKVKYLQRKGSAVHLYFTPNFWERYKDPNKKIYIIEGEKKALRGDQEGLCSVGISGIYGWKMKDKLRLIPDFNLVSWNERKVAIIPDADFHTNLMVREGTEGLLDLLGARGANVKVVDLKLLLRTS